MRNKQAVLVAVLGGMVLVGALGCSHEHHHREAEVVGPPVVAVVPGYYYQREYYDNRGIYHPRVYYHYDGHRWDRVNEVPRGYEIHERPMAHEGPEHGGH